jgi:hypothetical protein
VVFKNFASVRQADDIHVAPDQGSMWTVPGLFSKKLYAVDIYFLADPRILYEMKRLCFTLIVVAHTRWLNSFICSVILLPVTVVALICLLHFHFRLTVFLP